MCEGCRHQRRMYDTDAKAQSICMKVLYHNYHRTITPLQAIFMPCLVLTHSEHFHHQARSIRSSYYRNQAFLKMFLWCDQYNKWVLCVAVAERSRDVLSKLCMSCRFSFAIQWQSLSDSVNCWCNRNLIPCFWFVWSFQELCVDIWCHLIQHSLPADDQLRIFGMIFLNHLKVPSYYFHAVSRSMSLSVCSSVPQSTLLHSSVLTLL